MTLLDLYYQNEYDKLDVGFQLDKFDHMYLQKYYDKEFTPRRNDEINLLEIGVATGISMKFWSEWFVNGKIYGVDLGHERRLGDFYKKHNLNNIYWENTLTNSFVNRFENDYFDYLIDDGSHRIEDQIVAIKKYLPKIKSGGKLVIEDIMNIHYIPIIIESIDKKLSDEWNLYDLRYVGGRHYPNSVFFEIIRK